jgi:hypothetical protein
MDDACTSASAAAADWSSGEISTRSVRLSERLRIAMAQIADVCATSCTMPMPMQCRVHRANHVFISAPMPIDTVATWTYIDVTQEQAHDLLTLGCQSMSNTSEIHIACDCNCSQHAANHWTNQNNHNDRSCTMQVLTRGIGEA